MSGSTDIEKGMALISEPFLPDVNFKRSIVLLCEHNQEGDMGFILNRPLAMQLHELVEFSSAIPVDVYHGGPVQRDTLHVLHRDPRFTENAQEVLPGVWWGGDFDSIRNALAAGNADLANFRFFLGYSGWGNGQLKAELDEKSWFVSKITIDDIFSDAPDNAWHNILQRKGGIYKVYANSPENPQYN